MQNYNYSLPDCYIYLYHTDEYFILPQYPETLSDNMESNFNSQNALARTAPVYSYSNSGPRVVQVSLKLHRDMMNDVNTDNSTVRFDGTDDVIKDISDDYVDLLIKKLQSIALPRYDGTTSMVVPPMVAVRFGNEVFIKGVVASGGVSVSYETPIIRTKTNQIKYAQVSISFTVSEVTPYDATSVGRLGSFRGQTSDLLGKFSSIKKGGNI